MNTRIMWGVVTFLFVVIIVLLYFLVVTPAHAPTIVQTATTTGQNTTPGTNPPLHERVVVTSPKSGATVEKTFEVKGEAPGNWYFEASFPIQVRDADGNVIARTHANALSDWMTESQVPFSTTLNIDGSYSGPATLILMKDNPSGLPEHDDALEIPIVIK